MQSKLYDTKRAAEILGGEDAPIPVETLSYWRRIGKGPEFVKMGRNVRYTEAALIAFMNACARQSTSQAA